MRLIEAAHPDVEFDWPQILKGRPDAVPERAHTEAGGRAERPSRGPERPDRRDRDRSARGGRSPERAAPEMLQSVSPRVVEPPAAAELCAEETGPAHARLGSVGLARLRTRFADLSARIRDRVDDEEQRQELKLAAERLNPDGWLTDEAVSAGLESYEATFEAVKTAIGGRKKPVEQSPGPSAPESIVPGETQ